MPADQLPATTPSGTLTTQTDGEPAAWRYVEFFTANIRNPNTRRAYARACGQFFIWCEDRGLELSTIRPVHVAAWVEKLQEKHGA